MKKHPFHLYAFLWVAGPVLLLCWASFLIWMTPPPKTDGTEAELMKLQIEETKLKIQVLKLDIRAL
ncbi:MAG: hypothetical protein JKY55_18410 [Aliivibrio sp.]|uniref:hypothetical protein n=1 Tax=Aliivibrio sp. TaxID=1872443 RepID=UPI001A5E5BF5|nr:hypothetical protein [Aliivibrio sp.]